MKKCFLVGGMKCGTNSLYHGLRSHPQVSTPNIKEYDYFTDRPKSRFYIEGFELTESTRVLLDGTTQYSKYPNFKFIPERIFKKFKDVKIIYMMRDPVARAESHVAHNIARIEGLTTENWRQDKALRRAIVSYSSYYMQVSRYIRQFGSNNVLILFFEEFVSAQTEEVNKVLDFLDLPKDVDGWSYQSQVRNVRRPDKGADKFKFSKSDEDWIIDEIKSDISLLSTVTEKNIQKIWGRIDGKI